MFDDGYALSGIQKAGIGAVAFALAATVLQGASEFDITARGGCARIQQKHAQMIERGVAPDKATSLLSHKQPGCLVPHPEAALRHIF